MYKVFSNHQLVCFTNSANESLISKKAWILSPETQDDIWKHYQDFIAQNESNELYFTGNRDEETNFRDFSSFFTMIEAAGGVIKNESGKTLFIFRRGYWDLPKGKIEKSETPWQAALREVNEETGLFSLTIQRSLPFTWHVYPYRNKLVLKKNHWFMMLHAGHEKPVPQKEEDITDVRWFAKDDLDTVIANTYPSLVEMIKSI